MSSSYLDNLKKLAKQPFGSAPSTTSRRKTSEAEMRKTKIREKEMRMRKAEAARIASIGVNFNPLDPALDDVIGKPEALSQAMTKARLAETEQTDEIKSLQVKMNAARAQAGRDAQARAKAERLAREREMDRRADEEMERQRVAALQTMQREREERTRKTMAFAADCQKQLAEREYQRMLEVEAKIVEGEQMKKTFQQLEVAEKVKEEKKLVAAKERAAELKIANAKSKERRAIKEREEWERDQAALRYMAIKAEEERQRVLEEERVKREKALLQAKMLAEQERIMDTRGEEDAARARKHQEAAELAERRKIREKEERRRRAAKDCEVARQQQMALKDEAVRREKDLDKKLTAMTAAEAARVAFEAEEASRRQAEARLENQAGVLRQIAERGMKRMEEASLTYKERQELMLKEARRARSIAAMRDEKKQQLSREGIDESRQARAKV